MKKKHLLILSGIIILLILILFLANKTNEGKIIQTSNGTVLSNKKIGWGIRRNGNHEQPDLGATNKKLIDENEDIAIGNNNEKYVYLTFDEGYEARIYTTNFRCLKRKQCKSSILHNRALFKHSKRLSKKNDRRRAYYWKSYSKPSKHARFNK